MDEDGHTIPRPLVVKLANFKDKIELLKAAHHLDGTAYSITDDTELHEEV